MLIFLFGCGEIQEPKSESDSPEPEDAADGVSSENNITLPDSSVNFKDDNPLILPSKLPPKNGLVIEWYDDKTQKSNQFFKWGEEWKISFMVSQWTIKREMFLP